MPPERAQYAQVELGDVGVEYRADRDGSFHVATSTGETAPGREARAESVVVVTSYERDGISFETDGRHVSAKVAHRSPTWWVALPSHSVELTEVPRFPEHGAGEAVAGGLASPMPGKVTAVFVEEGDAVDAGALLVVVEAMKMEHRIVAPRAGLVTAVRAELGHQVARGDVLVVIEPSESVGAIAGG
jgi:biotin carboxyl carrier protein